jgi:hypothetical protein
VAATAVVFVLILQTGEQVRKVAAVQVELVQRRPALRMLVATAATATFGLSISRQYKE